MFKVKYGDFRDPSFNRAFQKIANCGTFKDVRLMRNIVRIGKLLKKKEEECQETYIKLLKQYSVLDEKGEFVPTNGPDGKPQAGTFQIKKELQGEGWMKALSEFNELECEIFADGIALHDLTNVGLTPIELGALEMMVKDLNLKGDENAAVTPLKKAEAAPHLNA